MNKNCFHLHRQAKTAEVLMLFVTKSEAAPTELFVYDELDRLVEVRPQTVVTSAGYLPSGPLASLALGNGLAEQRSFDGRYAQARIEVPGLLDAVYTTDGVGNILTIARDGLVASFAYQDVHYFLAETHGPWPARAWTYDRIGNRLTEGTPGSDGDETLTYTYGVNGSGGNTPQLLQIVPAPGVGEGMAALGYDAAGDQTSWASTRPEESGVETVLMSYGDDRRMSRIEDAGGTVATDFLYDGRSFLREAHRTLSGSTDFIRTEAVYSSEGVLHLRIREVQSTTTGGDSDAGGPGGTSTTTETTYLFYFAGRPVAQLIRPEGGSDQLVLLTTDHLGSPMLATDRVGAVLWQGGIAPFGEPFTLGDGAGGGDGDPPGSPGDGDDPNAPPPGGDPPPSGDGREPPSPPPPPNDGRDGPPPPPPGGGGEGGDPDGRDLPPPPPGGGGGGGGNPDGRPDPPPPPPPDDGRGGPPPPPPPPPGGGGDPNGRDGALAPAPAGGKALSLSTAEVFLRYPGQWDDSVWTGFLPGGLYYNVHRWYAQRYGRYTKSDPLGQNGDPNPYTYADGNPILLTDPLGEKTRVCCTPIAGGILKRFRHCFIEVNDDITGESTTFGLHRVSAGLGCKYKNDGFDKQAFDDPATLCGPWTEGCESELCVEHFHSIYTSPSKYFYLGPNSNTYASHLTLMCGLTPPRGAGSGGRTPGWGDNLPLQHHKKKCPPSR